MRLTLKASSSSRGKCLLRKLGTFQSLMAGRVAEGPGRAPSNVGWEPSEGAFARVDHEVLYQSLVAGGEAVPRVRSEDQWNHAVIAVEENRDEATVPTAVVQFLADEHGLPADPRANSRRSR